MDVLRAIVLGVVQGVAEFLPISSSGHLRLLQEGLGWSEFGLAFDVMLHVATLLAVIIYFRVDLSNMIRAVFSRNPERRQDRTLAFLVVVATIPTGIIGVMGSDWFETADIAWVGLAFVLTAVFLAATERLSAQRMHSPDSLSPIAAVMVGVAQGIAIMPGISRSGATMAAGLGLGLDREQAARFSFLLSGPIILLAGAKHAVDVAVGSQPMPELLPAAAGFIAAALTGYAAIAGLMSFLRNHTLYVFSAYTAILGVAVILWRVLS